LPGSSESTAQTRPQSNGSTNGAAESAFAASLALAAVAILGDALQPGNIELAVGAIAGTLGLVLGAVLGGLQRGVSRLPGRARTGFWVCLGALLGLWPALGIGAVAKLAGAHSAMAAASLAGAILGGASVGAYLSLGQPGPDGAALTDRSPVVVVSISFALLATVAESVVDDSLLVLRSYPPVRATISVVAALAAAHAGIVLSRLLPKHLGTAGTTAARWGLWLLLLASGVVAAARLSDERAATLLARPIAARLLALARAATDFDRDGSSRWFAGGDCAPFDGKVGPRAREIPGNGIDDNCRFGDARPRNLEASATPEPETPSPTNVIVVTVDSLRADHLGCYGYPRPTSPRLDDFAKSARRFTHAYTSGGWTSLAVPSMLTGLYPRRLDWEAVAITSNSRILPFPWEGTLQAGETWLTNLSAPVRMPSATLPRWLRRRGMVTAAVLTSKPAAIFEYRGFLEENFEKVDVLPNGDDAQAVDTAIRLVDSFGDRPFFLWVHLYDPHEPYGPHEGVQSFGNGLEDIYDHDVAFTDRELGRLFVAVDGRNGRRTSLVVTADHGESFIGGLPVHGVELHEESIRIPLLVRGPGIFAGVSDAPASLVDIAPTVFEWTETPPPPRLDGGSLLNPDPSRMPISDVWRHDRGGHVYIDMTGAAGTTRRLVIDRLSNAASVYAVGDISRPAHALAERPDPRMTALLGRYQEEMGALER
jgi:hypothetical protein